MGADREGGREGGHYISQPKVYKRNSKKTRSHFLFLSDKLLELQSLLGKLMSFSAVSGLGSFGVIFYNWDVYFLLLMFISDWVVGKHGIS